MQQLYLFGQSTVEDDLVEKTPDKPSLPRVYAFAGSQALDIYPTADNSMSLHPTAVPELDPGRLCAGRFL
jgi:hypothetical protein